jgi:FlaA1/EpsC-like NDP-sugar epimerase
VPGLVQIITGEVNTTRLRDVSTDELLERDEIRVNTSEIMEAIQGKVIMVTGGGGSIGSELCRQIAAAGPKQLIIFDIYENNAYDLQMELQRKYPDLNLVTLIGSVRNTNRVNSVLKQYHPDVIYHAAAHKHVPLMETSPDEAVKNNVMGTYKLATAAARAGVKRFLLISTDKAVNPTSLMGATKRICEMIIQMMAREYPDTVFMAVRFGNVLGSNGSVVPLFKKQIEAGGPVTVTDPNIIRYFMTIPEAVSLVLQASYFAKGGEIFVLDMGKPVRIDDMARNLIRLSGYKPDEDIKIVYTGLRPGEKLYEELLMDEEGMTKTENDLIYIGHPIKMDEDLFRQQLQRLDEASRNETAADDMKRIVAEVVTTYHPDLADSIKTGA